MLQIPPHTQWLWALSCKGNCGFIHLIFPEGCRIPLRTFLSMVSSSSLMRPCTLKDWGTILCFLGIYMPMNKRQFSRSWVAQSSDPVQFPTYCLRRDLRARSENHLPPLPPLHSSLHQIDVVLSYYGTFQAATGVAYMHPTYRNGYAVQCAKYRCVNSELGKKYQARWALLVDNNGYMESMWWMGWHYYYLFVLCWTLLKLVAAAAAPYLG